MSADIVKLSDHLEEVGEGYRFDPDETLEAAKGKEFGELLIIGTLPNGELYVAGSCNAGESLILMKHAERLIVFGETE